jgi:putative uncharacterized protein (fragment)
MPNDKTQKNLSSLHNTLETMGYEVPNIDQFTKYMRKEKNLRTVYDAIASDGGYELPDFETFKADMGWIKPTPAGVPTPLRPKDQLAPTGKPDAPATPFGFDLPANPKKPSHAPKARLGFPRLDKKMRPVQEVNDPSVPLLKTTRDVAQDENGNVVNVVQPELVPDFDPNNGGVTAPKALMDVTTGKTIRPTELSKEEVDGYNAGNIDAIKDPKLRQALEEANIIYTPTLTESDARRKAGELTSEIDKALAERTEYLDKKAGDVTIADSPTAWGIRGFNIPAAANKSRIEQANDSEYMMLEAARSTMHDVNNLIAEADHNTKEGGDLASVYERSALAGTLRGFGSTIIDPRVWDQGARDLSASSRLALALDKADRGEKLTRGEQLLLDAKANEMATALYFEDRIGRGYKAGSVTAHAIPFMVEMAMSGGISTMGKNVSSGLARYAMRRFGAKAAGKAIIKRTIRGAATTAGAMLAGGAMANTFGAMKTAANVVGRTTGDVQFATGVDAEGRATTTYGGHTEGDSLGEAFVKGELSNTSEYATELLGDGLVDAVKWAAGKVASPVASKLAQLIGKTGVEAAEQVGKKSVLGKVVGSVGDAGVWTLSKASKFIENMQASKFATSLKALEKQAQWNGVFGEYLEELANNAAAVMIGDKDLSADKGKGFFNLDDNIDTFLGVSLMGGVMSGAQTAGYFAGGGARGMARYQIGQSEGAVWSTLTTEEQRKAWDDVRRQILLQDGKEQVDAVKSALTNPNFNAEQRRAILDYTKSVQTYKGMSEYRRKQSEDTKADPLQNELADSYDKGAGMTQAEEMSHARSWYEFAQQKAAERLGVDANALDEMGAPDQLTLDQVAQLREDHNEQAVQSYVDYLNARATYEGMIGSVSQGIQAEAAQAEQAVRSQQHKDGTLRRATLRGTEGQNVEVHIKDGDLVMDEEGRIDTDKSSKDFIVRDNETGVVRFASIDDIISAEQPTSADDAVSEAVNAVYERREKEAADAINGTITPQVGAVYNLLDADGNPQQIAIQQVGQDGTLDVDYSGVPHKMTTDELQTMADNTRARQIENEHAAQVQQSKAEEREEREQAGLPRYALNDELTIRTPEGDEVTAYVTNEEDADGNIEVYFNEPFDGKKVHLFTKDYLDGVVVGTRLSPETNTSAGAVEAPATAPIHDEEENDIIGRSMTEEEAEAFLTAISNNHEVAPELELTPENWYAEFGEDGMVHTPIGDAHMGENQFLKMMRDGRKSKLGMIRPTLEAPHAIVEEPSIAKEGQETERDSSYIYIRVFEKEDGSRHYHFTSVSVLRDGGEVVVSNQEKSRNQVKRLLTEGVVLWMRADNAPDTSDVDQDLYSSQGTELSDPASEGTDASQSTPSESKDNESTSHADPNDESLSPEEAYEAVLRATNGDVVLALEVIESTIADKEKALAKAKKAKPRSADTIEGKIQAREEVAAGIEAAEISLAHWQAVAEIAAEQVQEEVAEVAEPAAEQTEQESEEPKTEQAPAEEETAEEEEQEPEEEATPVPEDTAPEWGKDNPADARARGYIKVEGLRVDRQGELSDALIGKESDVKFATNDTQQARYAIIEAESLQPSHIRGYQNQLHFIPEAQPKDRSDVVSEQAAVRIAANINPEEITTSATAYTGAPTINARGEVIQGNSRADALRAVWESFRDTSGAKYKQYLIDNAEDLGIDPEAIEGMKSPVLVHLADVSDERAIELGQYRQADIESGGVERINPQTLYAKIGEKRDTFIRFLLGTSDDDLSLAESITRNAAETLSWLNRQGFISDTQFRSAFGAKGEITAEAKEDLRNALYRSFFEGAHNSLEAEFYNLPKRTQQALLRVSYRDQQSPADAHFLDELQSSVSAYNALMGYAPFAEAKTFEDAEHAIETWMRFSGDLITGEVNSEQYSNFAVQLALRYKFYTQKELIAKLNAVYDAVQAVSEDTLFGEGEVNPKTLAEAVSEVFSIKYDNKTEEDGSIGSSSTGGNSQGSNGGEQEGQGTPGGNEQDQSRAGTPERRGGAASDPQEGEGVTTETEEVAPEAGDTQASDTTGEGYRLSAIAAKRGGNFFENSEGSIDLVKISDNVFEAIGIKPLPMRMTEAMAQHIIKQHAKELGISTQEEAVAFVVDIMQNFDHVREGNKPNTYIFSIEKGRSRTGKRAVTLVLPSKSGEYLGVSSSGYEKVSRLKERALLWEEGANNEAPTTETASANVTSPSATQGGMTGGSASNQSKDLSQGKDSEKEIAEGEADDGNQDDLSIEEKEALLSKAKQELVEKEEERTAVAEQAIALMKDYYDSGAIPGMDSGEFHGQATLILIGFKDRSNLELMKAPGLSELLPSLYKLADEARAKKVLVRKYEKELSQAKEVEGETLTHDKAIRDELVNTMRDAGIEVITDEAEGQAVLDAVHAGEAQMQRAYHGTDADFEAFDHSHMGEGAGGQAYGWGSYFTEEEGVARSYAGGGFVYEAELPDDTGSNYLHFESKPSNKDIARVKRELVKYILRNDEEGMYDYPQGKDDLTQEVDDAGEPTTWRDLYGTVSSHLGSDKEASAFFHSIGYVGIRYNSSESEGGKTNFVIFDESDISIQSKVRLFKTSSGEVYGFVKDGKIYLDLKHATAETAIHEYTHLWSSALRRVNPRAWKSIRKQLKGFELWADIASRYPELKGDEDALADEVLAQYSGKRGAQRIEEEMKKAENATDLVGKARVLAAFNSLKEALKTFWTEVADFFGMDYYKSVEDAADKAMSDLLRGVNPNAVEAKKETTKTKTSKKETAKKETATSSVIAPDSERYNGYIVTLPKKGKAGAEVGDIEEFVGADEMREGLMVVYQAPEGFAVASNGTMAIADKTQFDVYKKGKAYKLDGTTIDAGAWKPLKDKWQSFVSTETRGEHSDPFTESPVKIPRLSKYLDRVEQDLYNRWKADKSEGRTRDSFKTYRNRALVVIPNGRGGYVEYRYPEMRSMALAANRLGVTSFFVEGDIHYESSVYPGVRLVGNGRLGSVVHAGYIFRHDAPNPSESELSYLYDEAVGVKDTDEGVRMQKGDEGLSLQETSDAINARFNEELKEQIEGTLPKGHIYSLGMPSNALRSAGVPNLPIELTARRLATKASQEYHSEHPFELSDIQNLPQAIAHPIAVFDSSTRSDSTVVLTELQDSRGVNFVVALRVVRSSVSRSLEIDVNDIRSIYPKDRVTSILKWITSGKMLWVDKKKALSWITTQLPNAGYDSNATESLQDSDGETSKQRSNSAEVVSQPQEDGLSKTKIAQQRTNLADVDHLNLDSITKVVETFDNPPLASEDLEISNDNQASEDNDEEVRYRSSRLSPELQAIKDQAKADGIFMKAPNGRPTNLTEKQWLQVRTPEFKEWFGDWENDPTNASKVVDENGEPMVVYHGTSVSSRRFFKFKDGAPNWFTPSEYYAKAFTFDEDIPVMYPSFIKIKKLLYLGYIDGDVISGKIRSLSLDTGISESSIRYIVSKERADKVYQITNSPLFKREAVDLGYDGMMAFEAGVDSFAIFSPSQVKSATENTGSFDGMNDDIRYSSHNAVEQEEYDMQDLEEVATSMAEVLGDDVRVIHDTAEIEGRNESETNRMRGAKGWYDPKTGQVVVVLPNAESADDVEATILHEVVGHKGLQELVGKDQFGKFLDEVFEGANEAVRNGIVERSKRYGWNTRLATEEYIAELAEQGFKDLEARDLWNVVRNAFYNLLSRVKLALGWDISDRELRYMLWRTYQMKKGEGLMGQAKDIAMQEKLGVGNYEEARFRQGVSAAPVKVAATYDALIKKSSYQTQEALQDSMLSLKKVMEMIMQAKGDAKYIEEIEGYQNAYMGENRVSSVNQAEAAAYSRMALEPLVEEVSRLAKKAHHSYVTDYMMAKHGLERNRVMAFQKAVEADVDAHNKAVKESGEGEELTASSLWDAYLNDTDRLRNEADYREGRITADVWHKTDDEIRARYAPSYAEYRERDYAGLTGLLDRPDVDIQTLEEEAIEEVMKFEQENDVTDLWDLTNKATDAPLSKQYEGGLMSRETLEHVRNMYGYYIPLRGFDETTSDEAYSYLGDRDRAFSPTLKKAKGRSSKAEDPLAHIASMMESAILQSNRNKLVRQKFLNFVENNPSDLFSVQKLWVQWNEVTKAWEAVLPEFDPNDTSEEVIRKTQEFEEMMQENKRKDPKNFKLASEQPSIPYRVVSLGEQMQHQIIVKRGGRDVVIIVNGDPRVAMAVNGQTNPDGEAKGHIGALFRAGAAVNRKLAGFYTSLSPNFVVKNFIRDIIYANTIAWVKESPTYAMTYHANVAKLAGQMHRLVHLYEHDKLDMSNETHRAFKLFMENGGETGYSQLRSMDRHKKEIERMMKESGGRISPKQAFRLLGDTMEFANRGIEDLSRFAAFLTSRQMGRTIDRSIYDAKEMTVNFNKKGAGSTFYDATTQSRVGNAAALLSGTGRSLYLFWNVSIQGSVNIARAVKRNPKKGTAYLATFLALGILQTMLPALTGGDDDDRYWNLPDYVRRNNICFFVGDVLVKIPLPQEARAIFGIGELGMSYSSGKEDKTPMELAQTIAGQISQVMPLDLMDDSGATHALMPSLAKPFFEAQTNHSWMGRPIWKDTDYNKAMPDWTKAYKATGGAYVWLAKELNALTGGDDYKQGWVNINPARLEYMLKGYLGGLYTAADQIIKSSETAFGDREFSMRDVPILSGFLDGADERNDMRNVNNTYYHFKEEAKEVLRLGKSYESDLEQGKSDSTDYAKKLDELVNDKSYERALLFEDLSKEIEEMQKALKEATDPKEAEELQAEIDKQKKALVNQLRQMK